MPITPETLNSVVRKIVDAIHPERIYLFGSRAKGTARPDSDIDLCILADMEGTRRNRSIQIRKLFPRRDFSMDVLVFKPEEFDRQKTLINSISQIVVQEGKIVYERPASPMGTRVVR